MLVLAILNNALKIIYNTFVFLWIIFLVRNKGGKPNLNRQRLGGHKVKTLHYRLNHLSTQAGKSHAEETEAIMQSDLNETMMPMRKKIRRKIFLLRTPSTELHQYSPPSLPQGKKKKMGPTSEVRKTRKS